MNYKVVAGSVGNQIIGWVECSKGSIGSESINFNFRRQPAWRWRLRLSICFYNKKNLLKKTEKISGKLKRITMRSQIASILISCYLCLYIFIILLVTVSYNSIFHSRRTSSPKWLCNPFFINENRTFLKSFTSEIYVILPLKHVPLTLSFFVLSVIASS